MLVRACFSCLLCCLLLSGCLKKQDPNTTDQTNKTQHVIVADGRAIKYPLPRREYRLLFRKMLAGAATLAETRTALTDPNLRALTNTVNALYAMAWHRGVLYLMRDIWQLNKEKYPELNWALLERPPVRLALANVINRLQTDDQNPQFLDYIRRFQQDANDFNRAQAIIALGYHGDVADIDYIRSHVDNKNPYLTQTAVTALALMQNEQARQVLLALEKEYTGQPLGTLIHDMLEEAYGQPPAPRT